MRIGLLCVVLVTFMFSCVSSQKKALELNFDDDKQNFEAFAKTRSDFEGKETVYYWEGFIYTFINGQRSKKILGMKGFNVSKWHKTDSSLQLLTREVALYTNPSTNQILEKWQNPLVENQDSVEVIHVWNDPVNQTFPYTNEKIYALPYHELDNQTVCFYADIFLAYPSPLSRKEFPQNAQSDLYQGAELFQFFVNKHELANPTITNPAAVISWTRLGQWLPWMNLADKEGMLVYQCRGYKVLNGFEGLPEDVKDYVRANNPIFEHAPTSYSSLNETSWTYFKKLKEKK